MNHAKLRECAHSSFHWQGCRKTATHCYILQHTATHCNSAPRFSTTYSYHIKPKFTLSRTHTDNKHTHTGPGQTHNMSFFFTFFPHTVLFTTLPFKFPPDHRGGAFERRLRFLHTNTDHKFSRSG
mmetsp:Transcript_49872/g.73272  ORF Transcript_49872/g.73272 Transcript_49872/m.73272 type:complete len:125 (+) Transcript_49872:308-682(+)